MIWLEVSAAALGAAFDFLLMAAAMPTEAATEFARSTPPMQRADLAFERGEGAWLATADGTRYLDFMGGIAVNVLGHAHPHLVAALKAQAEKLWHVSNIFEIPGQRELGERLVANTFADRVFFSNSGAEAMECAIKTARRYHFVNGAPERFRIITFEGAFHGRTLATLAAGGQAEIPRRLRPEGGRLRPGAVRRPARRWRRRSGRRRRRS